MLCATKKPKMHDIRRHPSAYTSELVSASGTDAYDKSPWNADCQASKLQRYDSVVRLRILTDARAMLARGASANTVAKKTPIRGKRPGRPIVVRE